MCLSQEFMVLLHKYTTNITVQSQNIKYRQILWLFMIRDENDIGWNNWKTDKISKIIFSSEMRNRTKNLKWKKYVNISEDKVKKCQHQWKES